MTCSLQREETSEYCTVNHQASASNYQLSNMKCLAQDSNWRPQRFEGRTLTTTPPRPPDQRLEQVLQECTELNITLNKDKCVFKLPEVGYLGHIISCEGVKSDPEKTRAIRDMPAPIDRKGVERLLGTISYFAKFLPNMSSITEPIRKLLKKDVEFVWMEPQE